MFRSDGKAVHFHIRDFVAAMTTLIGHTVPELEHMPPGACFQGTPRNISDAIGATVHNAGNDQFSWREPRLGTLANVKGITTALKQAADLVAGEDADDQRREIALAYVLLMTTANLNGAPRRREERFLAFYYSSRCQRLTAAATDATSDEAFGVVRGEALQIDHEVHDLHETGALPTTGAFLWFPDNRQQARLLAESNGSTNGTLSREVREASLKRLAQQRRQDGELFRTDTEVEAVIAEVQAEIAARDERRALVRNKLVELFRSIGLPESVPVTIEFADNAPSSLAEAKRCEVKVVDPEGSGLPVDLAIMVETKPQDPFLAMLEKAMAGSGHQLEVEEITIP